MIFNVILVAYFVPDKQLVIYNYMVFYTEQEDVHSKGISKSSKRKHIGDLRNSQKASPPKYISDIFISEDYFI